MRHLEPADYPVYLHTHPGCFRAIKLYTDFGFALLTDAVVGERKNDLSVSLPYLRRVMSAEAYDALQFAAAPEDFLEAVKSSAVSQF